MTAKLPTFKQASIPQAGRIAGGQLDGWSYGLLQVRIETPPRKRKPRAVLIVRGTLSHWPFPTGEIKIANEDFEALRAPGESAQRHDTDRLIRLADTRGGTLVVLDQVGRAPC